MKIALIATYPPQQCGIGIFTHSLAHAMMRYHDENEIIILAIAEDDNTVYPPEVKMTIQKDRQTDYLDAANFINNSGVDVCILQHEYGIFGGQSGIYILPLIHRLKIPVITTLHTILQTPSYAEKAILQQICKMSHKVVAMSGRPITFLETIYHVPASKIMRIEHGIPDIHFDAQESKKELKLDGKSVLLTFGFVSRNKGIETAIKALPYIIENHPEILYIVLGKTHPNVVKHEGEEYRHYLQDLIASLELGDHVLLLDQFADEELLFKYLSACDIYITPYINEAQSTSGTLTYAMGAGCVVVSTPYWHAAELLTPNNGCLFDFKDHIGLSNVLKNLLEHPDMMKDIKDRAARYGERIIWPKIGEKYLHLSHRVMQTAVKVFPRKETEINLLLLPPFSLRHIKRITDDTGIIQHSKFGIPNFKDGYCLDDNARALLMVAMTYKQKKKQLALDLMPVYLSYILYMQNDNGTFRNFMSYSREFLDEVGSDDSFGRTIWALGFLMENAPNDAYAQTAKMIFFNAVPNFENIKSLRGIANIIIGISHYLQTVPTDKNMVEKLSNLTDNLMRQYNDNRSADWHWFESLLAYDNGILPLSLMYAYDVLKDKRIKEIALESMSFLTNHTLQDGYLSVIGNRQWFTKGKERSIYAQQPIDAMAMVLMYHKAYKMTNDASYIKKLFTSYLWFLGENDLRMNLYDFETKGCCDGFEDCGLNRNQGAESTLAYLISHLTVLKAYEESFNANEKKEVVSVKKLIPKGGMLKKLQL